MTALRPQRHEPPPGWDAQAFERVTDALAAALVAIYRRRQAEQVAAEERPA